MAFLNLPPVPAELKQISPYLQRADELNSKDPVISYWCAYYAAQVGIALKPKDTASRNFLFNLLGLLEHTKADLGQNDAVEDESAASAYIENFALKVFAMADNEDRHGEATRGTAKKFLAAANFLEVLHTFDKDKPDLSSTADSNTEKIRYAKWKAADIAKAFREGRKPTPGPAGSQLSPSPEPEAAPVPSTSGATSPALARTTSPPPALQNMPPPQQDSFFQRTPPPRISGSSLLPHSHPGFVGDVQTPGAWSNVATPGTPGQVPGGIDVPSTDTSRAPRHVWISGELEGRGDDVDPDEVPIDGKSTPRHTGSSPFPTGRGVRFTPSVVGGVSTPGTELPGAPVPDQSLLATPPSEYASLPAAPPSAAPESGLPGGFVPEVIAPEPGAPSVAEPPLGFVAATEKSPSSPQARQQAFDPQFVTPVPPPTHPSLSPASAPPPPPPGVLSRPTPHSPSATPFALPSAPIIPPVPPAPQVPAVGETVTQAPVELTSVELARAQKHCRFAVSALDYDDIEQARRELRSALRLLGG